MARLRYLGLDSGKKVISGFGTKDPKGSSLAGVGMLSGGRTVLTKLDKGSILDQVH